jgi:NAD-reducing hydrogenase large subunit
MDLYDGYLRALDAKGNKILDQVAPKDYRTYIMEEVRSWSYMKFPFIRSVGPDEGWYRVGPLARVNVCDSIDTPEAEKARKEFMALTNGKPNNFTLAYHWARMIEVLHSCEKMKELLNDPDLQGEDLVVSGERRDEGIAILEAPRGTLFHHYRVNKNDQVEMANLIVSTTNNNQPMNQAVTKVAKDYLSGVEITEGLLNHIEVAIRAYDPCLSCATHALGRMPLVVELVDAEGALLDRKIKD